MLGFFDTIVQYIELVWQFFLNLVTGLANLLTMVVGASLIPQVLTGYVFAPLSAAILALTALGVIKIIVGRDSI